MFRDHEPNFQKELDVAFRVFAVFCTQTELMLYKPMTLRRVTMLGRRWDVMCQIGSASTGFRYYLGGKGWSLTIHTSVGTNSKHRLLATTGPRKGFDVAYQSHSFRGSWDNFVRDLVLLKASGVIDSTYAEREDR